MAIKSGRYGKVSFDPAGGTAFAEIISINAWTGSFKTDYEDVSCYNDSNKVYVPGLMDIAGTFAGFWNSAELTLFKAAMSSTPGALQLMPNRTESGFAWQGPAYMSADIDCSMAAPKVTGTYNASGQWLVPGQIVATGATAGLPGAFTPAGATPPLALANMTGIVASPATNWTVGQHVEMGNGQDVHWNGTAWIAGVHP